MPSDMLNIILVMMLKFNLNKNINKANILYYISDIDSTLLSIYDIDINGGNLTKENKEYLTKMYILQHKGDYLKYIYINDYGEEVIRNDIFISVYEYIFGEVLLENEDVILPNLQMEKFYIDQREIIDFYIKENNIVVLVEYISKFSNIEFITNVEYTLKISNKNRCFLYSFVVK